jgi:hypothetical protein
VSDSEFGAGEFDTVDFDGDDSLRARLRGGDPAASLAPADPAALNSLLEDIMTADLDIRPAQPGQTESPQADPRRRTRATWWVAAAAVAVIAAGGAFAVNGLTGTDAGAPQADHKPSTTTGAGAAGQTTELSVADQQGKCASPDPAILAQYPLAFEGTVTSIEGDTMTIDTTDVLQGDVGETVQVTAPQAVFNDMINTVNFEVGHSYLVAAYDGQVSMCYSGSASGELRSPFDKAFVH